MEKSFIKKFFIIFGIFVFLVHIVNALSIDLIMPQGLIGAEISNFNYTLSQSADNCSLYTNVSSWGLVKTQIPSLDNNSFEWDVDEEGVFIWNVLCYEDDEPFWATQNQSFTLDLTEPEITLISPDNNHQTVNSNIDFEFFVFDYGLIDNCTLIINGSVNTTRHDISNDGNNNFSKTLETGNYNWAVACSDSFGRQGISNTRNLTINSDLEWNTSLLNVGSVPSTGDVINNSAVLTAVNRNDDIVISCLGDCDRISTDFSSTSQTGSEIEINFFCSSNQQGEYTAEFNATSDQHIEGSLIEVICEVYEALPDLFINESKLYFSGELAEGSEVIIRANVSNIGDITAFDVNVSFFYDEELIGYDIQDVNAFDERTFSVPFILPMGQSQIIVKVDQNNEIDEYSTLNNNASFILSVSSWQRLKGNVSGSFVLQDATQNTVFVWEKEMLDGSNLYVVPADSNVNWNTLRALTRDENHNLRLEDFEIADDLLGTSGLDDSLNQTFGDDFQTWQFSVFGNDVDDVPIFYTRENFKTGVLWDYSTDTNGFYDSFERETLVFVTEVVSNTTTDTGIFDYEIEFIASLRNYVQPATLGKVSIYVELK